jgi:extradiol dioxygenase family protein
MVMLRPFHLAFPVRDLEEARTFYVDVMGCSVGRTSSQWIDFDLMGHQVVAHVVEGYRGRPLGSNPVDGHGVPVPHFGVILTVGQWEELSERLEGIVDFIIEPHWRFKGKPGEQASMFFTDPSGNTLEFKCYRDDKGMFAAHDE